MTKILITLQGTICVYLLIGFILKKVKFFTEASDAFLSDFVLGFLLPMNVFMSFLKAFTKDDLTQFFAILAIASLIELIIFLVTKKKIKGFSDQQMCVARYGLLVSNGTFVGTPVIEGLFGPAGVVYCNVFLIPNRVMAFSAGDSVFNPQIRHSLKHNIIALFTNKVLIACFIGMLFVFFNWHLPDFMFTALNNVGSTLSPLSIMLVGSLLGREIHIVKSDMIKISTIALLRQVVIPAVLMVVLMFTDFTFECKATMVLLTGMPIAASTAIFTNKFHGDVPFASTAVLVSTLSSIVTLVALMPILEMIFR